MLGGRRRKQLAEEQAVAAERRGRMTVLRLRRGGADPDLDYSMQDNDDDLSEVSESAFPSAL